MENPENSPKKRQLDEIMQALVGHEGSYLQPASLVNYVKALPPELKEKAKEELASRLDALKQELDSL